MLTRRGTQTSMLGNFSASVLKVDIDGAAFTECNAFLGSKTGFQLYAQLALADPERGAFFWPPEGNDGSTTAAEVPSAGSVALEYPTYGPKPEAKEEGDGDEAEATAETEETPVGPYGDPERAKQFDLSKDSMNTLLNCPLNVRVFASALPKAVDENEDGNEGEEHEETAEPNYVLIATGELPVSSFMSAISSMDAKEVDVSLTIAQKAATELDEEVKSGDDDNDDATGVDAGGADTVDAGTEEGKASEGVEGKVGEEGEPAAPGVMSATVKIQSNLSLQSMAEDGRILTFSSFAVILPDAQVADVEAGVEGEVETESQAAVEEGKDSGEDAAQGEKGAESTGDAGATTAAPMLQLSLKQDFVSFEVNSDMSGSCFPSVTCFLSNSDAAELKKSITATGTLKFLVEEKGRKAEAATEGCDEDGGDDDAAAGDDATAEAKGDDEEGGAGADDNIAEPEPSTPLPSYEAQVTVETLLEVGELSCTFESVELGAGGSISGTVVLSKALVPIPPEPPAPELTLDDIVPERPPIAVPTKSAHAEMKTQVAEIASTILDEIDRLNVSAEDNELLSKDERRRRLLNSLNTSGKYYNFRENMRKCIIKVVKENFAKRADSEGSDNDSALFLTELYAHLMEHVHTALNTEFEAALDDSAAHRKVGYDAIGRESPLAQQLMSSRKANAIAPLTSADGIGAQNTVEFGLGRLLGLSFEAEVNGDFASAGKCLKDRVALSESEVKKAGGSANVSYDATAPWCDLACFHGRRGEIEKAIECASEAVAVEKENVRSLCLYGAFLMEQTCQGSKKDRTVEAAIAFEAAMEAAALDFENFSRDSTLARGLLGALYHRQAKDEKIKELAPGLHSYLAAAKFLAEAYLFRWGENVLKFALEIEGETDNSICISSQFLMAELNHGDAVSQLEDLVTRDPKNRRAWALLGQCYIPCGKTGDAMRCFQHVEALPVSMPTTGLLGDAAVRQMYGKILLDAENYESAREVFLRGAKEMPNATLWCGAGVASLRLGEVEAAELALSEANLYDNHNAEVWGFLALVCMNRGREQEAAASFKTAISLGLGNPKLLFELGQVYANARQYQSGKQALQRAIAVADVESAPPSHVEIALLAHKALGDVLAAQNRLEEALASYANVHESDKATRGMRKEAYESAADAFTKLKQPKKAAKMKAKAEKA